MEVIGVEVIGIRPELRLVAVVDELVAEQPSQLPPSLALQRTRVLLAQADRLRTLALQGLSDVETRQLFTEEGAASTTAWVRAQPVAGLSASDVTLARRLRSVPLVETEVLAGRLSAAAGARVTTAVLKARPFLDRPDGLIDGQLAEAALYGVLVDGIADQLAEQVGGGLSEQQTAELRRQLEDIVATETTQRDRVEAGFVLLAQRSEPALLPGSLALLIDALLPREHDVRARRADEDAQILLQRRHGGSGWTIDGQLDDETGELLDTVLRAVRSVDVDAPGDTDAWRAAAHEGVTDLDSRDWPSRLSRPRTRRQQAHDALRQGLRTLLDAGLLGTRDKAAPHVNVTVSLDFLHGLPGALPGRTTSGARWSRRQLRALVCRSTLARIVLDARRRVVEASHSTRTLTAAERQMLHLQWGGRCAVRACHHGPATGHPLVPHHGTPYRHTGTTALDDAVPLCEQDHHDLHDRGRRLRLRDGRWIGPDGWVEAQPRAG